ncbi:olfactory receptor 56A4-like [Lissotriton helveticus]
MLSETIRLLTNNSSSDAITEFILLGFRGFQQWQHWLSIPLAALLLRAVMGNTALTTVICKEQRLHEPMCFFLCYLTLIDLPLSMTTTPTILAILWFGPLHISPTGCFTQMYFVHLFILSESGILAALAFDRYAAVCSPLRYTSILNNKLVLNIMLIVTGRSLLLTLPVPLFAAQLRYCSSHMIEYPYCNNLAVTKLSCDDISLSSMYQMIVGNLIMVGDLIMIFLSYSRIIYAVLQLRAEGALRKAFGTCSSHLIIIFISYSAVIVVVMTHTSDSKIVAYIAVLFNVLLLIVPPAPNPAVYGVRNKEINQAIRKNCSNLLAHTVYNFKINNTSFCFGKSRFVRIFTLPN